MFNFKKLKKNFSGMTLVEVVVAMAYFSTCMLGVTMSLAAALKYTTRNQKRDAELNVQQTAIEKKTNSGVALNSKSDGTSTSLDEYKIVFNSTSNTKTVDNITQYKAIKTATSGNDYNFEIKSLSSTPLGCLTMTPDVTTGDYGIYVVNNSDYTVDVKIEVYSGYIYEGSRTGGGYKHSSPIYVRTLEAKGADALLASATDESLPDRFLIGYYNSSLSSETSGVMQISITVNGIRTDIPTSAINSYLSGGRVNFTVDNTGGVSIVPIIV